MLVMYKQSINHVHSIKGLLATGASDLGEFLTTLVLNILLAYCYIMAEYQAY